MKDLQAQQHDQSPPGAAAKMSRREFLIWLAVGAGASVAEWQLFTSISAASAFPSATTMDHFHPRLRDDVVWGKHKAMLTMSHGEQTPLLCAVNDYGAKVLSKLDGDHTIEEIAEELAGDADEALAASVAVFVARLSELGFLQEHFYAYIIEREA